jgi:hypothetical protein
MAANKALTTGSRVSANLWRFFNHVAVLQTHSLAPNRIRSKRCSEFQAAYLSTLYRWLN